MADHVHLLLFVREWMPQHLGRVLASLKAKCSQAWWELQGAGLLPGTFEALDLVAYAFPYLIYNIIFRTKNDNDL